MADVTARRKSRCCVCEQLTNLHCLFVARERSKVGLERVRKRYAATNMESTRRGVDEKWRNNVSQPVECQWTYTIHFVIVISIGSLISQVFTVKQPPPPIVFLRSPHCKLGSNLVCLSTTHHLSANSLGPQFVIFHRSLTLPSRPHTFA